MWYLLLLTLFLQPTKLCHVSFAYQEFAIALLDALHNILAWRRRLIINLPTGKTLRKQISQKKFPAVRNSCFIKVAILMVFHMHGNPLLKLLYYWKMYKKNLMENLVVLMQVYCSYKCVSNIIILLCCRDHSMKFNSCVGSIWILDTS